MKKIVKILSLAALVTTVLSCDNESSEDTTPQGQVTGEWQLVRFEINGIEQPITDCYRQSTFTFDRSGTFSRTTYLNEEDCVIDDNESGMGTWEWIESFRYDFFYDGEEEPRRVEVAPDFQNTGVIEYLTRGMDSAGNERGVFILFYERVN